MPHHGFNKKQWWKASNPPGPTPSGRTSTTSTRNMPGGKNSSPKRTAVNSSCARTWTIMRGLVGGRGGCCSNIAGPPAVVTALGGSPHNMANKINLTKNIFKLLYQSEILTRFKNTLLGGNRSPPPSPPKMPPKVDFDAGSSDNPRFGPVTSQNVLTDLLLCLQLFKMLTKFHFLNIWRYF